MNFSCQSIVFFRAYFFFLVHGSTDKFIWQAENLKDAQEKWAESYDFIFPYIQVKILMQFKIKKWFT